MRVARSAAAASGTILLLGLAAGAAKVPVASQSPPEILIQPGLVHLHTALQSEPSTAFCERHFKIDCYTASQIQQAFDLKPLYKEGITGKGQTIIVVDSYGSPTVRHDLAV